MTPEVALTLGIDRSRVNLLALRHGIGLASGPRGTRLLNRSPVSKSIPARVTASPPCVRSVMVR